MRHLPPGTARPAACSMISRESMLKGGDSGPAIVPGDPDKSLLLHAVHQTGELKMPPRMASSPTTKSPCSADWVKMGAPWPKPSAVAVRTDGKQITQEMRDCWSFQPLNSAHLPT